MCPVCCCRDLSRPSRCGFAPNPDGKPRAPAIEFPIPQCAGMARPVPYRSPPRGGSDLHRRIDRTCRAIANVAPAPAPHRVCCADRTPPIGIRCHRNPISDRCHPGRAIPVFRRRPRIVLTPFAIGFAPPTKQNVVRALDCTRGCNANAHRQPHGAPGHRRRLRPGHSGTVTNGALAPAPEGVVAS